MKAIIQKLDNIFLWIHVDARGGGAQTLVFIKTCQNVKFKCIYFVFIIFLKL